MRSGYKQTEVGIIPMDWECTSVRGIASTARNAIVGGPFGSDLVSADYVDDGVPVIRGTNMSGQWVSGAFVFVTLRKAKSLEANLARSRDIVFTQRGTLGQVSLVPDRPFECYLVSQSQMKLSVRHDRADPLFFYYVFISDYHQNLIRGGAIQTGVPHINLGILRNIPVQLPPLREQRNIAEALNDTDALLGALEQLIAKKRDLKQAVMQQLLTGQIRLPGFQGEWEVKRLGEVAAFHKGKGLPKSAISAAGVTPCIHYGELFTLYGEIILDVNSCTDAIGSYFRSVKNDVLMPTSDVTPRGLAKASCVEINEVILGGDILVIRSDIKLIFGPFLSYLIRYEEEQVLKLVTGSTVFHLYAADMRKFTFSMPSLNEQIAIAKVLSDMSDDLSALEQRRSKTHDLKQAMMQELLTGRIRLV